MSADARTEVEPNALQARLQRYYDLETEHRVEQYLISDPELASALGARPQHTPEQLLVHQQDGDLNLSLYLAPELLAALRHPNRRNLHQRLIALEGISHFLYLVWRAERGQAMTQLELELQAEIDKFLHATTQPGGRDLRALHLRHFSAVRFRASPGSAELAMYQEANRLAARYCERLIDRYDGRIGRPDLRRELRRFYRLPPGAKPTYINRRLNA